MSNHLAERQINVDGIALNYKPWPVGQDKLAGEGAPIIILHGWGSSSEAWTKTVEHFPPRGYRICVLDLPGFGQSDPPPRPWGVSDYACCVARFAEALSMERFFLIGHSFGGRISIRLTILHPERLLGLVLCASAGIKPKPTLKQMGLLVLAKVGHALLSLPVLKALQETARKGLYFAAGEWDYYRSQGVMRDTIKRVLEEDLKPDLGKIVTPTLILWGREDQITPLSDAYTMKDEIPNAALEIVEGAGHRLPYEKPEIFAYLVLTFIVKLYGVQPQGCLSGLATALQ
ncbi:MAG: alpha/beta fold hydrolase [Anaerolineae bacterium]